jgi:DNA-binding NtrC family response regulator
VEGESGTGKELVAEVLHGLSGRGGGPFEVFDCTAVPATLMESHLFGHVRGAFTGADAERAGALERARGGTLLVDEVGELTLDLQAKLLRAIDRKEFRRVGGEALERTDARIVAATNRTLEREVEAGRFRGDLFFRLAVVRVRIPPLRERLEDVPLLVEDLEEELGGRDMGRSIPRSTVEAWQVLPWPGNVRELRNAVERTLLLGPEDDTAPAAALPATGAGERFWLRPEGPVLPYKTAKEQLLARFERDYWQDILARFDGNVTRAAAAGGIHRKSLEYLLKKLGIDRKSSGNLP